MKKIIILILLIPILFSSVGHAKKKKWRKKRRRTRRAKIVKKDNKEELLSLFHQGEELIISYSGDKTNFKKAEKLFNKIKKKEPKSSYPLVGQGLYELYKDYEGGGNFKGKSISAAAKIFQESLDIDAKFFDANFYLGFAFLLNNQVKEGKIFLKKLEDMKGDEVKTALLSSYYNLKKHNIEKAVKDARKVIRKTEKPAYINLAYEVIIQASVGGNKLRVADNAHKDRIEIDPKNLWNYSEYLTFLINNKRKYDEAIEFANKAIKIKDIKVFREKLGKAYFWKGWDFYKKKEYEEAKKIYERGISEYSDLADLHYGLGLAYFAQGAAEKNVEDLDKAKMLLERALIIKPDHDGAKLNLKHLDEALKKMPRNPVFKYINYIAAAALMFIFLVFYVILRRGR